jgi:hypothetical protein
MEERRCPYRVLVRKPDGKRPLVISRCRWDDISELIFKRWDGGAWTGFVWFRIGTGGRLL